MLVPIYRMMVTQRREPTGIREVQYDGGMSGRIRMGARLNEDTLTCLCTSVFYACASGNKILFQVV